MLPLPALDALPATLAIAPASLFVVSGGGRGITARCVVGMAERYRCRFLLLGRSSITEPEPDWAAGCHDDPELRRRAGAHLRQAGGHPTPLEIARLCARLQGRREVRQTLAAVAAAGGSAAYLALDITDGAAVRAALPAVLAGVGPLRGIIHGAGVLADKRIEAKSQADFEGVFAAKVTGLQHLLDCVDPRQLSHLILFSSVASVYGNAGQTDYALANEILNKLAHRFRRAYPACRVVAFDWGPWDGGMVGPALREHFARHGVEVIPATAGVRMFVDELAQPTCDTVQVLIGSPLPPPAEPAPTHPRSWCLHRQLSLAANPFLEDHVVNGQAVLPVAAAVAWMAEACAGLFPGYVVRRVEDYRLLAGIVFDGHLAPEYTLNIREVDVPEDGAVGVEAVISSLTPAGRPRYHHRARLILARRRLPPPAYGDVELGETEATPGSRYYHDGTLFHGPRFQGIRRLLNAGQRGLTVACELPPLTAHDQGQFPTAALDYIALDVTLQTGLIWGRRYRGAGSLPRACRLIEVFRPVPRDVPFYVSLRVDAATETGLTGEMVAHDRAGRVYMRISGAEGTLSASLNALFLRNTLAAAPATTGLASPAPDAGSTELPALIADGPLVQFAQGSAAEAFGPRYAGYAGRRVPCIPNGDLQLVHRVRAYEEDRPGRTATLVTEYDAPDRPWFSDPGHAPLTPLAVYLEIALQPGAIFNMLLGSLLESPGEDYYGRALEGTARVVRDADLRGRRVTNTMRLRSATAAGGMIIQQFAVETAAGGESLFLVDATIGYFTAAMLAQQIGLDGGRPAEPWHRRATNADHPTMAIDLRPGGAGRRLYVAPPWAPGYRLREGRLDLLDELLLIPHGGEQGKGYIYATRAIRPDDWFFALHFFGDPVMPGSLGIAAMQQALQVYALHLDLGRSLPAPRFAHVPSRPASYKYRGQILPGTRRMALEVHVTEVTAGDDGLIVAGDASLWNDRLRIYEVKGLAIGLTGAEGARP